MLESNVRRSKCKPYHNTKSPYKGSQMFSTKSKVTAFVSSNTSKKAEKSMTTSPMLKE